MSIRTFQSGRLSLRVTRKGGMLLADVISKDEPDILYSIRLDTDEGTVAVYDPASDEGETIYEGPVQLHERDVCPVCHAEQKPGELRYADGRCHPACLLPSSAFLRGAKK